jgi:hypothetical protein
MIMALFIKILYGFIFLLSPPVGGLRALLHHPRQYSNSKKDSPQSLLVHSPSYHFFKYLAIGRHHPSTSQCRLPKRIRIWLIATADAESAFWCQG